MTEDRRTWQAATPGEDLRERDEEPTSPAALDNSRRSRGPPGRARRHNKSRSTSSASPRRMFPDGTFLDFDDAEVTHLRDEA